MHGTYLATRGFAAVMTRADEVSLRQFTAVAIDGRALLIEGPPGCGKTSLALALIDRGAMLISDDGVALSVKDGSLIASPPSATAGKIEIRNVGIATLPATEAQVALLLSVDPGAPRFVEQAEQREVQGLAIPVVAFSLGNPADPIRAEYALSIHGLR